MFTCFSCGRKILSERQAVKLSYISRDGTHTNYLCREMLGKPGCAEDILGVKLPELLPVPPPRTSSENGNVLYFRSRPSV